MLYVRDRHLPRVADYTPRRVDDQQPDPVCYAVDANTELARAR